MKLERQVFGETAVIVVDEPRIDAAIAIQFKDKVRELADGDHSRVVLDLAQVQFLDSSGLGALVAAMKNLGPGQKMELAGLTRSVEKVFRLTRMDTVFTIHKDSGEATGGLAHVS